MRLLLIVSEVREVQGRGVLLAPEVAADESRDRAIHVSLLRPDGTSLPADAHITIPSHPTPGGGALVSLKGLTKEDVPVRTEVWVPLASERPPAVK